jgi:hypothetical protein
MRAAIAIAIAKKTKNKPKKNYSTLRIRSAFGSGARSG